MQNQRRRPGEGTETHRWEIEGAGEGEVGKSLGLDKKANRETVVGGYRVVNDEPL